VEAEVLNARKAESIKIQRLIFQFFSLDLALFFACFALCLSRYSETKAIWEIDYIFEFCTGEFW
jgi:hypothetical protein